jgi:transposase
MTLRQFVGWFERTAVLSRRHGQSRPSPSRGGGEAIEAAGASLVYLPPYGSDLNPIEMMLSKLKALLRKAAERSIDAL